ncbi:MAG: hypothetical protein F6J86_02435 [Symploca sp. SIO1B1]|nr:hypothetical protein [Symploca sp. SIO1B1]
MKKLTAQLIALLFVCSFALASVFCFPTAAQAELQIGVPLGQSSVNTQLTPNSNAVAVPSGDSNNTTQFAFQYNNTQTFWSPSVSTGFTTATNAADVGNSIVTFTKGLTVQYLPQSAGMYTVIVTGTIIDGGTQYPLKGQFLGSFPSSAQLVNECL